MKIKSFRTQKLNGFFDFDIRFKDGLSFLTGINGSGKTTALNAIVSLITPDLSILSHLQFNLIELTVDNEGSSFTISATGDDDEITVAVTGEKEKFSFNRYIPSENVPSYKNSENEYEYYRDVLNNNITSPVIAFIKSLPTPMFLGLDRRARYDDESFGYRRRIPTVARHPNLGRNIFNTSLTVGMRQVIDLAEETYREASGKAHHVTSEAQRKMAVELMSPNIADFGGLHLPTKRELTALKAIRRDLGALTNLFNLSTDELKRRIEPFITSMEKFADTLKDYKSTSEVFEADKKSEDDKLFDSLLKWSTNRSQIDRMKVISDTVQENTRSKEKAFRQINQFLELLNNYFKDSGKSLFFDERSELKLSVTEDRKGPLPIQALSSGEAQIFVILTHLAFNPAAQKANVFIIDEPELSLHIRWQELFVDSIIQANPNIQYILATHSPSIIMERTAECIDIAKSTADA